MHRLPTNPLTKADYHRHRPHTLAVIGHLAIDSIVHSDFEVPSSSGGSAAAIATASVQLGIVTSIYSKVGKDFPSQWLVVLERLGVDISRIEISDKKETLHIKFKYDKKGNLKKIECNDKNLTKLEIKALPKAECIHICPMEPRSQVEILQNSKDHGDILSISFSEFFNEDYKNMNFLDIMDWSQIDIVFANEPEAKAITKEKKYEEMAYKFFDCGVPIVVITLAKKGSIVYDGREVQNINARDVKVIDPTGCGDSYIGGFLGEYLISRDIRKAAGTGTYLASLTAQKKGSWAALLSDAGGF